MRYAIFSDIHSNLEALEAVIRVAKKEAIDKYLCIGDVVGYAANPKECIEKVRSLCTVTVAGNHDWASVRLFSLDHLNPLGKEAIIWTIRNLDRQDCDFLESLKLVYKNEDLTLVHGTLNNPGDFNYMTNAYIAEETFRQMATSLCFVGHTHSPIVFIKDKSDCISCRESDSININPEDKYIINVVSVGQPRDGNPKAAFCIYDSDKKKAQIKRVDYDTKTARKKIIDMGLPQFLGERLLEGR